METRADRTGVALSRDPAPLPIAAEIDARLVVHRQRHDPVNLAAVGCSPVVFPPCRLLREPQKVRAGDVMMVSNLAPAHPAKEALGGIGIDFIVAAQAVGFFVIDPMQRVAADKLIPGAG